MLSNKNNLIKRSREKTTKEDWYAFGRSQALSDTYKNKLALNNLVRTTKDLKIIFAPQGTGIYSGLYITSNTIHYKQIKDALNSQEFISYISLLGKYKSGGYYTFSSKDIKAYLDFKFSYNGGLLYGFK